MTQEQYVIILKCIHNGVPALEDDLIKALNTSITKELAYDKSMTKEETKVKEDDTTKNEKK